MPSLINNIGFSTLTFISQIISGSVVYILFARLMNISEFGLLTFGLTFAAIATVVAEFGFSLMSQRDIPQNRFNLNEYVYNSILIKTVLSVVTIVIGIIYLNFFFKEKNIFIGYIFLINAIITSYGSFFLSIYRAKNKFKIETKALFIYSVSIIIIFIYYYSYHLNVIYTSIMLLISRFIQLVYLLFKYKNEFGLSKLNYNKNMFFLLFKNSFSYGIHFIIGIFYFTIDNQMIAYYWGNNSLAIYQALFRVVLIMLLVSDVLINVFLPYLSSQYSESREKFLKKAKTLNSIFFTIGIVMFVFIILFAEIILKILYENKYAESISVLIPLGFVLIFRIMSSVYAILLTISNNQKIRVKIVFVSFVVNVILNIIIIPIYSIIGAAYVSLITHFILFSLYVYFTKITFGKFLFDKKQLILILFTIFSLLLIYNYEIFISGIGSFIVMVLWSILFFLLYGKQQLKIALNLLK